MLAEPRQCRWRREKPRRDGFAVGLRGKRRNCFHLHQEEGPQLVKFTCRNPLLFEVMWHKNVAKHVWIEHVLINSVSSVIMPVSQHTVLKKYLYLCLSSIISIQQNPWGLTSRWTVQSGRSEGCSGPIREEQGCFFVFDGKGSHL